jgi:hypothetical protein
MSNSQTVQEMKTATMSNSQTIQELKDEFMDSNQFTHQVIANIEGQIGQLASQMGEREKGKFQSQPVANPKGQFVIGNTSFPSYGQEHVQAITTLRSGRQVDNQVALSFQLLKRVPRSLFPTLRFQKDLQLPRKAQVR